MRLNLAESDIIQNAFRATFHQGRLYLFGSRVDDGKRGGDIDVLVDVPARINNPARAKILKHNLDSTLLMRLEFLVRVVSNESQPLASTDQPLFHAGSIRG